MTPRSEFDNSFRDNLYIAILAGGIGTRLWPCSRQSLPKQFVDISGQGRSMIQDTVARVAGLVPPERIFVVTGQDYADIVATQLPEITAQQIIVEPNGRNTAPAIGLATVTIQAENPAAIVAVLPADHAVTDSLRFQEILCRAIDVAELGWLATLGITPTYPHTGYGYIQRGRQIEAVASDPPTFVVERFLEKPDYDTAQKFLDSGEYYWNGGIFVYQVETMLHELKRQLPLVYSGLEQISAVLTPSTDGERDPALLSDVVNRVWPSMTNISIDHGVMEAAARVSVVPLDAGWNDVGSWDALAAIIQPDADGNVVVGETICAIDSTNNIVYANKHFVALIGMQDLVVVNTNDCLLIGPKNQMQRVKEVVEELRADNRKELL